MRHADGENTRENFGQICMLFELHIFLPLLFAMKIIMISIVGIFPAETPDWVFMVTSDMRQKGR